MIMLNITILINAGLSTHSLSSLAMLKLIIWETRPVAVSDNWKANSTLLSTSTGTCPQNISLFSSNIISIHSGSIPDNTVTLRLAMGDCCRYRSDISSTSTSNSLFSPYTTSVCICIVGMSLMRVAVCQKVNVSVTLDASLYSSEYVMTKSEDSTFWLTLTFVSFRYWLSCWPLRVSFQSQRALDLGSNSATLFISWLQMAERVYRSELSWRLSSDSWKGFRGFERLAKRRILSHFWVSSKLEAYQIHKRINS